MSFQLVIFDLGGVLVHMKPALMIRRLAAETGQTVEVLERVLVDPALLEQLELGRMTPRQYFDQLARRLKLSWSFEEFVAAWNGILSENTDTTGLLQRLWDRYTILVLTNTNILHDEHIRRTWPVFDRVHHWLASYQIGLRKPEPQIYELALRTAQTPPHSAIYIDDVEEHVLVARGMGLTAVHFTDGKMLEEDLRQAGLHV